MKRRSNANGSNIDDWATPDYILNTISKEFGPFYDPCPLKADFDGLALPWQSTNYINPPYSRQMKEAFIRRACEESKQGNVCIMLLPASTDTKIFHEVIVPNAVVRFIKGRIKFKGINTKGEYVTDKCGQHGSMLVIFDNNREPSMGAWDIDHD